MNIRVLPFATDRKISRSYVHRKYTSVCFSIFAIVTLICGLGSLARADMTTFDLTKDETGGTVPPGSVVVTVDLTATGAGTSTATLTFTGKGGYNVSELFFNVNGSYAFAPGSCSSGCNDFPAGGGLDAYGMFSGEVQYDNPQSSVTISLIDGSWTSALNVLTKTTLAANSGDDAAATVTKSTSGIDTGNGASDIAGAYTPEPSSYLLFGSGLLALGAIFRKRLGRTRVA
jgi:PEP-CTERM motif-containing protein